MNGRDAYDGKMVRVQRTISVSVAVNRCMIIKSKLLEILYKF